MAKVLHSEPRLLSLFQTAFSTSDVRAGLHYTCGVEGCIELNCGNHSMCKKCLNAPERRNREDLFSCETCDLTSCTAKLQDSSIFVSMDNSNIWSEGKKLLE